ncbi:hypothetical protein DFH06DRAFT_1174388 [Mycena polygramma]|nr:hypothetical protein DFH06DRAFT_1174388 [Mycena polygramma]
MISRCAPRILRTRWPVILHVQPSAAFLVLTLSPPSSVHPVAPVLQRYGFCGMHGPRKYFRLDPALMEKWGLSLRIWNCPFAHPLTSDLSCYKGLEVVFLEAVRVVRVKTHRIEVSALQERT